MHHPALIRSVLLAVSCAAPLVAQTRIPLDDDWTIAVETAPGELPTEGWRPVRVPSTFEDVFGADFDGVCWYRRTLTPAPADLRRRRLVVHGAATDATVYLDGQRLAHHLGAWTPFTVDLPPGGPVEASLEIRVDEKVGHNTQGFLPVIQPHVGGLWRDVELALDDGPVLQRENFHAFGELAGDGPRAKVACVVLPGSSARRVRLRVALLDGALELAGDSIELEVSATAPTPLSMAFDVIGGVRPWAPDRPSLYRLRCELTDSFDGRILHALERRIGFRHVGNDGTTLLWNGRPTQLRGVLHWGYSAPHFAPPLDADSWRAQLEGIKSLGFNLVKVCLWMPPQVFYEIADEIGLVVWQEYPTWHPQLTPEFLPQLRTEYGELHRYDRSHPSVAIRSLTCETGHSADLAVVKELFDRCKEIVPNTLLVDDSAWISWHRIHDFWDDHPYGNNSWWPGKLAELDAFIAARRPLPLLLGECIASDTWMDLRAWDAQGLADDLWWAPWGLGPQRAFESFVKTEYGPAECALLGPESRAYALRNRKYQIERLRLRLPDAGYTVSVVRDFSKARMGLWDDFGTAKWSPEDWSWQGDTMVALDVPDDRRAFSGGRTHIPLRVSHYGRGTLHGTLVVTTPDLDHGEQRYADLTVAEGELSATCDLLLDLPLVDRPRRFRVNATLSGTHPVQNHWDLWVVPEPRGTLPAGVRVVEVLDLPTLDYLEAGGRVLLRATERDDSLRTARLWFLKGAPMAPAHAIHAAAPPDFLRELQSFDLETDLVMNGDQLLAEVDPVLAFWDTHDIDTVNRWLLAFSTRVGAGRLAATTLAEDSVAGRYVFEQLAEVLESTPAPRHALSAATIARLRGELTELRLPLVDWEIALDPDDVGLAAGWATGEGEAAQWQPIRAGAHWESQGFEHYDGVAWYRTTIEVPASWDGRTVTAVFDGVDDSYRCFLDGRFLGAHGDPTTGETVWLVRTTIDLGTALRSTAAATLVLRVVDHVGAGGLHRPVWLTTAPVDRRGELLR